MFENIENCTRKCYTSIIFGFFSFTFIKYRNSYTGSPFYWNFFWIILLFWYLFCQWRFFVSDYFFYWYCPYRRFLLLSFLTIENTSNVISGWWFVIVLSWAISTWLGIRMSVSIWYCKICDWFLLSWMTKGVRILEFVIKECVYSGRP